MDKFLAFIKGKKTHAVALVLVLLNFAVYMKWLSVDQLGLINTILAGMGLSALRSGVSSSK